MQVAETVLQIKQAVTTKKVTVVVFFKRRHQRNHKPFKEAMVDVLDIYRQVWLLEADKSKTPQFQCQLLVLLNRIITSNHKLNKGQIELMT